MIKIKVSGLKELEKAANNTSKNLSKNLATAINKATTQVYSATSNPIGATQQIREYLALKSKDVKKSLKKGPRAKANRLYSYVNIDKDKRINLINFGARQTKAGVAYRIEKNGGRKTAKGAFIAPTKNRKSGETSGKQVFRRKTKSPNYDGRLPLMKLQGVSVWGVVVENKIDAKLFKTAEYRLNYQIEEQAKSLVRRFGK